MLNQPYVLSSNDKHFEQDVKRGQMPKVEVKTLVPMPRSRPRPRSKASLPRCLNISDYRNTALGYDRIRLLP